MRGRREQLIPKHMAAMFGHLWLGQPMIEAYGYLAAFCCFLLYFFFQLWKLAEEQW